MLALAGGPLDVRMRFLDPARDACAGQVGELVVAAYDDPASLDRLAAGADVIQTTLGFVSPTNYANRGCMSQNGSDCLSEQGRAFDEILDVFLQAARGLDRCPCTPPFSMHGLRVARRIERGKHRRPRLGAQWSGGIVVEIGAHVLQAAAVSCCGSLRSTRLMPSTRLLTTSASVTEFRKM